jgi:2-polyprenyl-6-methoxyphenol hydroxylase-like FAD-dependent oxidoreductase
MHVLIAGGGIGGLTAALTLHRAGHQVTVFEQSEQLRPLGVGINLLPHAVGVLAGLGLLEALKATGIEAAEYVFMNEFGQTIFADPRAMAAGYDFPQLSIHRGEVQMILYRAALAELGPERLRLSRRLAGYTQDDLQVEAHFEDPKGTARETVAGDLLIGADGIHSVVRARLYPDEGPPIWNGATMWRGVTRAKPFLTGASVMKAGWTSQKFTCYPISRPDENGDVVINWIANLRGATKDLLSREDWNRRGNLADFLPRFASWHFPFLDVPKIIADAPAVYEFPMVDRDPLPHWSDGRVTLLGDAAHPMYPISSNGATQAIIDAQALTDALVETDHPVVALQRYEAARIPPTAKIIEMNRQEGPDVILDIVRDRAPEGFTEIQTIVPLEEIRGIVKGYKVAAGHRQGKGKEAVLF